MSSSRVFSMSMTSVLTGVIFLVHQTGAALGSWLAGALEAPGGYGAMFAIAGVLLAGAGVVSLHVDREPRRLRWVARGAGA
jgi:predicted MFS family arabinose efflux permease